ncbi:MAG: hypothetical protein WAV78_23260 [Xanthobacteraceae bacterium]
MPGWFALLPGEGENFAHRLLAKTARDLGFLVDHDAAANTYVTMAGRDRTRPSVIIGSHLDSVWDGGNFDGAAGIVAGLIAINALKGNGFEPRCDMHIERGPVLEAEKLSRLDRHRDTWQLAASRRAHHRQIRPLWRRAARLSSRQRRCRR